MGLIYKNLTLVGSKGKKKVNILFDTGASDSFIREDIALTIANPTKIPPRKFKLGKGFLIANQSVFADIKINGFKPFSSLIVVSGLSEEVILGADFFQRWKIKLDPEKEKIIIDPGALKIQLI